MKIESLKIRNYKVFRNVEIRDIPSLAVFLGKNGTGKSTFFDIFGFLHDCLNSNVRTALMKRGGYKEVVSREQTGDIEFAVQFRPADGEPLITYEISIGLDETGRAVVKKETLRLRRGQKGSPWKVLDFSMGEGIAAKGKLSSYEDVSLATRERQKLDSPDILAIKGLGQFKEFEAVATFRKLIEDWYVSDFRIDAARDRQEIEYSEHLTKSGDNLSSVTKFLYDNHPDVFSDIIEKMKQRVPGVEYVEAQETQDGYIVLRFQDGTFKNPFSSKYVSDGTIKMFTYLVLLHDPTQHALLCVEEPENQNTSPRYHDSSHILHHKAVRCHLYYGWPKVSICPSLFALRKIFSFPQPLPCRAHSSVHLKSESPGLPLWPGRLPAAGAFPANNGTLFSWTAGQARLSA